METYITIVIIIVACILTILLGLCIIRVCCRHWKRTDEDALLELIKNDNLEYDFRFKKIEEIRQKAEVCNNETEKKIFYLQSAKAMVALNHSASPRTDVDVDFHGLKVQEVKCLLPVLLEQTFHQLRRQAYTVDSGKGNHSQNGLGVLKHVVHNIVTDNGYSYTKIDDGLLMIHNSHSAV